MKRNFFLAFLCGMLAVSSVFMSSCGDDDDDDVKPNNSDSTQTNSQGGTVTSTDLEGTWTSVEIKVEGGMPEELSSEEADALSGLANFDMNKVIKDLITFTFKGNTISGAAKQLTQADLLALMKESLGPLAEAEGIDAMLAAAVASIDMSEYDYSDFEFPSDATFEVKDNKIVTTCTNEDGEVETEEIPFELKDGKLYITTEEEGSTTTIVFEKKN